MTVGETIYSSVSKTTYVVCQVLKKSGQAELAFAKSDSSESTFLIKKLINVRYYSKGIKHKSSIVFEKERRVIYNTINLSTLPNATCSYIHDFFREKTFYYIVTEKVVGIPLNPLILSKAILLEERLALFRRIVYSFIPFERGGIVHGDVKPDNILLKRVDSSFTIRLIDFETSFFCSSPPAKGFIVGTEPYYSPELALYNDENNDVTKDVLSTKSDIFSLGIILFELLTGFYPTTVDDHSYCHEIISRGKKILFPTEWSKELQSLINDMLSIKPSSRPGIMEIVERLKLLPDKSSNTIEIISPETLIYRISEDKAFVSLFSYNLNSEIDYSLDNGEKHPYQEPFIIEDDDIDIELYVKVKYGSKTIKRSFNKSISVSPKRSMKIPRPIIKVNKGQVTISCAEDRAIICYTLDGSTPTKYSKRYDGTFSVGEKVLIKAIARCIGMIPSDVTSINSSSNIMMT